MTANQDPTAALRLAEQALKMDNNPIVKKSNKIYRENSFYKIIAKQANAVSSPDVSPDGTKVVTGSPDGKCLLNGSFDRTTRLWEIPMPLQDFLKNGVCEPFTWEQLKEYGIEEK